MVDWITVEGFKSIRRIERLALNPINVLIGPNGSGKSNFLGAFSFLREIRTGRLQEYVIRCGGAAKILHFGSKSTRELTIHISFESEVNQYKVPLTATEADTLSPLWDYVYFWDRPNHAQPHESALQAHRVGAGFEAGISGRFGKSGAAGHVRKHLDSWRIYHLHDTSSTSPIKKTADVDDNRYLRHDGANLAAFLYFLWRKHEEAYDLIRRTVRLVAPFFDDFRLQPRALNEDKIRLEWRHLGSDAHFDASSLSDGTLRFIVLATLLLQPAPLRPSVILLDEPELGAALLRRPFSPLFIGVFARRGCLFGSFCGGQA